MWHNPQVYKFSDLVFMSEHEIAIAQYELHLAFYSLIITTGIFIVIFMTLKWILPNFWYKDRVK